MENRELCTKLLKADSELEAVKILKDAGYWNYDDAWRPYGDLVNNYGTIGNQQSEAVSALVEKIVNAIDARLTNECLVNGQDPESPDAPGSIREAVHRYFGGEGRFDPDRSGHLSNWTNTKLNQQGDFITVTATGWRPGRNGNRQGHPCLTIADKGEGQTPDAFPRTFLSLHGNNKIRTTFVQGKFNMGATGSLPYCSDCYNLQMVLSRRNPELVGDNASERDRQWGFTVVRRKEPSEDSRSSVFEYLAPLPPKDSQYGEVLSFSSDTFPIFPNDEGPYHRLSEYGSLVKLYEYHWEGTKSNIIMPGDGNGLIRRIEIALAEPALPFKLYEHRQGYKSNEAYRSARGILTDLERHSEASGDLEEGFPQGVDLAISGHQVGTRIYAFKPGAYGSHRTASHGVLFLYNGQVHAYYSTRFFRRQSVRKSYLANDLLVTVDCSSIVRRDVEDLFMNSRDRLRSDSRISKDIEEKLEEHLFRNEQLRALEKQRREAATLKKHREDQIQEQLLKDILADNPELSRYLLQGANIPQPGRGPRADNNGHFEGKRFPTFFQPRREEWSVGVGKRAHIQFETDAENGYFDREVSPGSWSLVDDNGESWTNSFDRTGPIDGIANFYWDTSRLPLPLIKPGDAFLITAAVRDESRPDPFESEFLLNIIEPTERGGGNGSRRNGGSGGVDSPNIHYVQESEWESHNLGPFNSRTAVRIAADPSAPSGREAWDFFVNVDNENIHNYVRRKNQPLEIVRNTFSTAVVFLSLGIIRRESSKGLAEEDKDSHTGAVPLENLPEYIDRVSESIAPVLLPVIDSLRIVPPEEGSEG